MYTAFPRVPRTGPYLRRVRTVPTRGHRRVRWTPRELEVDVSILPKVRYRSRRGPRPSSTSPSRDHALPIPPPLQTDVPHAPPPRSGEDDLVVGPRMSPSDVLTIVRGGEYPRFGSVRHTGDCVCFILCPLRGH